MTKLKTHCVNFYFWLQEKPKADTIFDLRLKQLGGVDRPHFTKTSVFRTLPELPEV